MESDNTTGHKKQELCFKIKFAINEYITITINEFFIFLMLHTHIYLSFG